MKEGYGSAMLEKPELIKDMVHVAKEATNLPCSIKIRYNSKDVR
jgi:tRNA-dihydrouridine synthase